jgi:hypothetical protein
VQRPRVRYSSNCPAQRLEGRTWQRGDRAAEAVQDIALEELPDLGRQVLRPRASGKGGDAFDH